MFIDQDIEAPPGWLDALLTAPVRLPIGKCSVARSGRVSRAAVRAACGREPAPITTLDFGSEDRDIPHAWGANMMIRRSAFDRVGYI